MFKLNMNLFNTLYHELIKKNLDKLNKFKKNKNLNNQSKNISNCANISNNDNLTSNRLKSEAPNKIFYS